MGEKVLVVNDSPALTRSVGSALEEAGYRVEVARDRANALEQVSRSEPSLVILAEAIAQSSAWLICRDIRKVSRAPILALMEDGSEEGEVVALRTGADMCLARPFSPRVLVASVGALMRRRKPRSTAGKPFEANFGDLVVDTAKGEAKLAGEPLDLTPTEFRLLAALARRPGQVVTAQQLMGDVWGPTWRATGVRTTYLKQYVWHLRQKVEADAQHPRYILSKRGIGYYLGDGRPLAE